jgi:hypothetical protein
MRICELARGVLILPVCGRLTLGRGVQVLVVDMLAVSASGSVSRW